MKTRTRYSATCGCEAPAKTRNARREALLLLAALGLGSESAQAQDPAKSEPRSYKVLFENKKVRILEYTSRPGLGVCGTGMHSHPDHVTVSLTPAKVKVTAPDGATRVVELPAGTAFWAPAATHASENIGGSGSRMVLVEIKDKDWAPATG